MEGFHGSVLYGRLNAVVDYCTSAQKSSDYRWILEALRCKIFWTDLLPEALETALVTLIFLV